MKRLNQINNQSRAARSGFTLIELMVVIVIIAILMALILPALNGVRIRARQTQVAAEITQLDQAIASFKAQFGVEPPSSIYIPVSGGTWDSISRSKIRSIWPQFNFDARGGLAASVPDLHLSGAECLVFFLGGMQSPAGSPKAVFGFSKNPRTPWTSGGTNKDGPYFEFDAGRFVDVDGDGLFEFVDTLPDQAVPYLYLSSQGKTYGKVNKGGATLAEQDDFDVLRGPANPDDLQSVYLKTDGSTPQRAHGYQIISPGIDGAYGPGGVYNDGTELTGSRALEADNITNFSNGRLLP